MSDSASDLEYPTGAIRITDMRGLENDPKVSVSLSDILDADRLEYALMSSFLIDEEWLLPHFKPTTNITLVLSGKPLDTPPSGSNAANEAQGHITRVYPELPKPEIQIMHIKIMLLFYAHHVRLVVSTANLVEIDWSMMHNSVFIQDFPREIGTVFEANSFSMSLAYALHDISVPYGIIAELNHVDFSAAQVHLVTTVPTGIEQENMNSDAYGMEKLTHVIRDISGASDTSVESVEPDVRLYCSGSSMGRLDRRWLRDFYLSALGVDVKSAPKSKLVTAISDEMVDIAVAFHTEEQAENCMYGPVCRQHLMCNPAIYKAKEFPKDVLFKLEPRFPDTLVHAKVILARKGADQKHGWVYIGSHNFTPAAWGRIHQDRQSYFNNYELGIVIPDVTFRSSLADQVSVFWKEKQVPLPFKVVWEPYGREDTPCLSEE